MADIAPCRVVEATETDADLTAAAVEGDGRAFDELYRRHRDAALRVALATVRNPDDARDAVAEAFTKVFRGLAEARSFRPYLLATVRNCALDIVRRDERWARAEVVEEADDRQPVDRVVADEDERIVVQAFSRLPERWQRALWLIDVEELSTQEAGSALGVSANNAAQLASRARLRLREHYLQAHVPNHIGPGCGVTVAALGSFVARTASPRTRSKVEAHLRSCEECRARVAELRDVAVVLRRAVLPLPVVWAERGPARGRLAVWLDRLLGSVSNSPTGRSVISIMPEASTAAPLVERLVAGTTAAVLAAGLTVLAASSNNGDPSAAQPGASPPASTDSERDGTRMAGPGPAGVGIVGVGSGSGSGVGPSGAGPGLASLPGSEGRVTGAPSVSAAAGSPGSGSASPAALPFGLLETAKSTGSLAGLNLSGANLAGASLPGVDLSGVNLTSAVLSGADLTGANLTGANLTRAVLDGTNLSVGNLKGANLTGAALTNADLTGAVLTGAKLPDADLSRADVIGANLAGALLTGARLPNADLTGVDLTQAGLAGTDLTGALLTNARLPSADLTGALLSNARLPNADLTGANLTSTRLVNTDLRATDLSGVDIGRADLTGALLPGGVAGPPASLAAVLGLPAVAAGPAPPTLPGLAALAAPAAPTPSLPLVPSLSEGLLASPGSLLPAPVLPARVPPVPVPLPAPVPPTVAGPAVPAVSGLVGPVLPGAPAGSAPLVPPAVADPPVASGGSLPVGTPAVTPTVASVAQAVPSAAAPPAAAAAALPVLPAVVAPVTSAVPPLNSPGPSGSPLAPVVQGIGSVLGLP